jgi:hypothetical protein
VGKRETRGWGWLERELFWCEERESHEILSKASLAFTNKSGLSLSGPDAGLSCGQRQEHRSFPRPYVYLNDFEA